MDLGNLLNEFILKNGLSTALVVIGLWFAIAKVWPWYTEVFIPSKQSTEAKHAELQQQMLFEIKELREESRAKLVLLQALYNRVAVQQGIPPQTFEEVVKET